ncbi:MAG: squalene--hopene cyclase [Deltaproteobacteria bacterium]|nr:squalene--hopene cyclase [Deltaproteobacteria bacterium]
MSHRTLEAAISLARERLLSEQSPEGYWWYTLEANETIGAGTILLMHYTGVDPVLQKGLARRIVSQQKEDGSWSIYYGGPGDLSATVECYVALKMAGVSPGSEPMVKAKRFILAAGGAEQVRVFSRIHLALFGLVPWESCPSMPLWFMLMPSWLPVNIYEFSSWARASIVPLLIVLDQKKSRPIPGFSIDEIFKNPSEKRDYSFPNPKGTFSGEQIFILLNQVFKKTEGLKLHPGKKKMLARCECWIRDHIERTEDIFPAMAYAIYALSALGYPMKDPTLAKAWQGLKSFQQAKEGGEIHQQCCISPVWDTPWASLALLEGGEPDNSPPLLRSARWLISKQILDIYGDWSIKNKGVRPGGWAFEFQNDYFPDVDDTIEVLLFLERVRLPGSEKKESIKRGLDWLLSMQCQNGGWAAFDKENTKNWVNRIPFSDHGACLDPPTPDITGRMLELLGNFIPPLRLRGGQGELVRKDDPSPLIANPSQPPLKTCPERSLRVRGGVIKKALNFLKKTQEPWGGWWGRWGVNYIYGTWAVLQGLAAIGEDLRQPYIQRAVAWLKSCQLADGSWGESCAGYSEKKFVPLKEGVASQTAWALMGLIASGESKSAAVEKGISWLVKKQTPEGGWDEPYFTGTGFPGHFYIRYHGYRQYFPVLALGKYFRASTRTL